METSGSGGRSIDPRDQVAALAHPLRARLFAMLRQESATATALARALGTNSGATSYHLRQLAAVGLIEPADGSGRRRPWQVANAAPRWRHESAGPDEDAMLDWIDHDYLAHFSERAEQWLGVSGQWPQAWNGAMGTSDSAVLVTASQAASMRDEINEVMERYRRQGQGNPSARRVAVYLTAFPLDQDRPPRE